MNIGLLGIGTIGSGVFEQINQNFGKFSESSSIPAKITKVLDKDLTKKVKNATLTDNPDEIFNDNSIEIIIALMGGEEFEYEQIKRALENKKHVVTANKAVIGAHLEELSELAKKNNVMLRYEASVGGGIPIIKALEDQIRNNEINEIKGILNGTTNFILTKMIGDKVNFENSLKEAQAIGFAEANPESDLKGSDAARKLAILSSLAYGKVLKDEDIPKRGILNISTTDINEINRLGYTIKHLAQSINKNDQVNMVVEPVLVKKDNVFSKINNEFNLISLNGDKTGELMFYGKGAGKDATANAVVSDVLDIINALNNNQIIPQPEFENDISTNFDEGIEGRYYLRVDTDNSRRFSLSDLMEILEDICEIEHIHTSEGSILILTDSVKQSDFEELIEKLDLPENEYFFARILD